MANTVYVDLEDLTFNVQAYGALGDGSTDDRDAFQAALDAAGAKVQQAQLAPGYLYWIARPVLLIPSGYYLIGSPLDVPKGVDIRGESHAVLTGAAVPDKCFRFNGNGWQTRISGLTFLSFTTAIEISTSNNTSAVINIDDVIFQFCSIGIDTLSYNDSRSTNLAVRNCVCTACNQFLKSYADIFLLDNCAVGSPYTEHPINTNGTTTLVIPSTVTQSATATIGSGTLTGMASTTGIYPGMNVSGPGVPDDARVSSTTSSTVILSTSSVTSSGTFSYAFYVNTADIVVGMSVTGTDMPANATIVSKAPGSLTLSSAATGSHSGVNLVFYSGEGIMVINSQATISSCLFIPGGGNPITLPTVAPNRHWVRFEADDYDRGLKFVGCRISAEPGSFTIVRNYAAGQTSFGTNEAQQIRIVFEDCADLASTSSPTGWQSPLVLYAMPNVISFERCGGTSQADGLVVADSTFTPPTPNVGVYTITIDGHTRKMQTSISGQPILGSNLLPFVTGLRSQWDRFRGSFIKSYEGLITPTSATITVTGDVTNGSLTIANVSSTSDISDGFGISGTNIPNGAHVVSHTATTITMDLPATGTATFVILSFERAKITLDGIYFDMTMPYRVFGVSTFSFVIHLTGFFTGVFSNPYESNATYLVTVSQTFNAPGSIVVRKLCAVELGAAIGAEGNPYTLGAQIYWGTGNSGSDEIDWAATSGTEITVSWNAPGYGGSLGKATILPILGNTILPIT